MGGRFICAEYRRRFILEYTASCSFYNRKLSRFYFTRDLPFWHYPPFCRYGYECKQCVQVQFLWEHCLEPDFEEIYQQVIVGNIQLTLF